MFLSRRSNGIYHSWLADELGRKRKVSTDCKTKADALRFVRTFGEEDLRPNPRLARQTLRQFSQEYLRYSETIHTPKTREGVELALNQMVAFLGDCGGSEPPGQLGPETKKWS